MSEGKITFVGAGPGAPDLLTLRGAAALAEADSVIYAGSLVDERLLEMAPRATFHNSAKLSLPEVLELLENGYRSGKKVVRLHTGDPSVYGAVSEQYRELDARGIPYEVVPGVSSVFAAAAALHVELTMPDISQSVILTREAGRTPVPPAEALPALAAHGTTLCLFLSIGEMEQLCTDLLKAGRAPETPVAVVYRASWENQEIVRGTISDIATKVHEAGIQRQAIIVVGDILRRTGSLSRLYDPQFATGYRHATTGFHGKCAIFGLTRNALLKAAEIAPGLDDAVLFTPEKHADAVPALRRVTYPDGSFAEAFHNAWLQFDGFVMVMAAGIVTRHLATLAQDKKHDPAVVVCDEAGRFAIPLLSGHIGGANTLAQDVAHITGGQAVLTTASDVRALPALDEWAVKHHYRILTPENLKSLATAILEGAPVSLEMPRETFLSDFANHSQFSLADDRRDGTVVARAKTSEAHFQKERFHLGIGCRKDIPLERLNEVIPETLAEFGYSLNDVSVLASASVKREEKGLLAFAQIHGKPLRFFEAEELNAVSVPHPSEAAWEHLGIHSVSEAAALLAAGDGAKLVIPKQARTDITLALAKEACK